MIVASTTVPVVTLMPCLSDAGWLLLKSIRPARQMAELAHRRFTRHRLAGQINPQHPLERQGGPLSLLPPEQTSLFYGHLVSRVHTTR